jgi:hypothetical protein
MVTSTDWRRPTPLVAHWSVLTGISLGMLSVFGASFFLFAHYIFMQSMGSHPSFLFFRDALSASAVSAIQIGVLEAIITAHQSYSNLIRHSLGLKVGRFLTVSH